MARVRLYWIAIPASLVIVGAAYVLSSTQRAPVSNSTNMALTPRHPVTKGMAKAAVAQEGEPAPTFELTASDGKRISSTDLLKKGPVVVVMTKDGCPCSIESQPYFNRLSKAYANQASFVGLLDASVPIAQLYKGGQEVPYPVLSATTPEVYRKFDAKQSVYTYLIDRAGLLVRVWPGYSASMIQDLNSEIARACDTPPKPVDVEGAPTTMTSGCYFFSENPSYEPPNKP